MHDAPAYDLTADPYFQTDITGHLSSSFGDAYALHVEPHDNGHHCYVGCSLKPGDGRPIIATLIATDPRDVLALAVAIDNTARIENGEVLNDGPFDGFVLRGQRIHNPFADPEHGQWLFSNQPELRHPREEYGAAYETWRDQLAEERARQIAEWKQRSFAERIEQERSAGQGRGRA